VRFFLDNCSAPVYAEVLKLLAKQQGYPIVHLREKFAPNTKDPDWIRALADEEDWVIVSGDPRITRGKAEREAWRESRITAFFFGHGWSSRSYWHQAEDLVRWWPKIVLEAEKAPRGKGFLIPLNGKEFQVIYDPLAPPKIKR
jgi:hypothetical protein